MAVDTKPSILDAAVLPAMATAPKELMELWISTLEMANEQPWMPAGRPIFTMPRSFLGWTRSRFKSTR